MNRHIKGNSKNNSKGFYIALGICLIAVGVAAWTTYDSVVNYAVPDESAEQSQTAPTNNTVSGVFVSEPESSHPASSSKAKPASSSSTASKASKAPKKVTQKKPAKQTAAKPEVYCYPVGKVIVQKFSEDPVYCKTTDDWRAHTGVDLRAAQGEPVKAIADGKVKKVYCDDRYGNTLIITHGDLEAWYCGLDKCSVKENDTVKSGQSIATVGAIPIEKYEESHLHLAIIKGGKYLDPVSILSAD